ncbi:hypothetical protein IGI04_030962 [Brassica rapa subsp. trilocularis]|uniref:Uncharacterized protein n=1 Tax=Brassica rapa subsp. trilocularis TaxID=1813537 RepID=A0ABQ7LW80_BRACM|nr:hypothetical protein IGI04_030962 [Brassica rapa subsp. trilocularis]
MALLLCRQRDLVFPALRFSRGGRSVLVTAVAPFSGDRLAFVTAVAPYSDELAALVILEGGGSFCSGCLWVGGCGTGLVSSEARLFPRSDETRFQFDDCSGGAVAEMDKLRRLCCVSHSLSSLLLDWNLLGSCSDQIVQRWSAEAAERLRRYGFLVCRPLGRFDLLGVQCVWAL